METQRALLGTRAGRAVAGALAALALLTVVGMAVLWPDFSSQGIGFSDAIYREVVATELVATLVGSIGLAAAVPLTTATAALLATRLPTALLPDHDHAHHH